ncbi:TPA: hypothetical protein O8L32_000536 [Enterobacter cloacae]|nr:hypothetical protein [Enterobacter cloacae]
MSVKRYECGMTNAPTEYQSPTMHQDANGGYVSYEDYTALEQKLIESERYGRQADITIENLEQKFVESQRELRAADATSENLQMQVEKMAAELSAVLTDRAVILEDFDNTCFEIGMRRGEQSEAYPTPIVANHDAFLAEVRASALPVEIAEIIDSGDLEAILFATEYPEAEKYRMALYNFRTSRKGVQS